MKELNFIEIIKQKLDDSSYLGDDCAFLDDLDIFVTQDSLVENVHFSLNTITPYLLGRKSVSVNLSDLSAALALPKYITVSLSLPKNTKNSFVDELYKGINDVCREYNVKVIGGDITGSKEVVISICAIGKKISNYITSRSFAKQNDCIVVTGSFGASAAGFHSLANFLFAENTLLNAHLNPTPRLKEAEIIRNIISKNIAMMDCSDGLIDALYKTAQNSKHSLCIDINKVPVLNEVKSYCKRNSLDYKKFAMWGAEDYELLFCIDEKSYDKLDKDNFTLIGKVLNKSVSPAVIVKDENKTENITKDIFEYNSFNHF